MELKIKNATYQKLFIAILSSGAVVLGALLGTIFSFIVDGTEDIIKGLKIFCFILLGIWIFYFFVAFVFYKTVVVTEKQIILRKRKKIIWSIKKEDILECTYARVFVNGRYYPTAGEMFFKLKSTNTYAARKIWKGFYVDEYIAISFKNVKKMVELGYKIKITNE